MAAPNDSGSNGGEWGSADVKNVILFGVAYGVATTIVAKTIGHFTSGGGGGGGGAPPKKRTSPPPHCKFVWDFYHDCLRSESNDCREYHEVIKKCHEAESSPTSDHAANTSLCPTLLLVSYHGCRSQGDSKTMECNWLYKRYLKATGSLQ